MKQYAASMGFRLIAFPLGVWAIMSGWAVIGWVLTALAIVIPAFAVAMANAVDHRTVQAPLGPVGHHELSGVAADEAPTGAAPGSGGPPLDVEDPASVVLDAIIRPEDPKE